VRLGAKSGPPKGFSRSRLMTQLYGPAVRCKLNLQSGSDWSCASVSGPCVEQIAPGHHGYPRVRSHSEIGPRRPVGSPDHERDGETVLHLLKSNSQTSAGVSYYQAAQGLTEAIPSEPPSLARLIGERRWRRGMAVIPLVNQSELIALLHSDASRI